MNLKSLVSTLTSIKDRNTYFADCVPQNTFEDLDQLTLDNPYPDWVDSYHDWAVFGTFTDYVIRRMIKAIYKKKVKLNDVIIDRAINDSEIRAIADDDFIEQCTLYSQLYDDTAQYRWQDILPEIYYMSHFDVLYRNGIFNKPKASDKEIMECMSFFYNIEQQVAMEYGEEKSILLNPTLGYVGIPSDADIITDTSVIDIKTTKYPKRQETIGYYQLLGYLCFYNRLRKYGSQHGNPNYPTDFKINKIGFMFPLHSCTTMMDVSNWTDEQQAVFWKKLLVHAKD